MKRFTSELKAVVDLRLMFWRLIIVGSMLLLAVGLFSFQVIQRDRFVQLATDNRLRVLRLPRVRGEIYDRSGRPLALNVMTFDIWGYPLDLTDQVRQQLVNVLGRNGMPTTMEELDKRIRKLFWAPYRAVSVVGGLTMTQMTAVMSDPEFPSVLFPQNRWRRTYPAGALAAHVVGQVGEISESELAASTPEDGYVGGEVIGKDGVERYYESLLRGRPGEKVMEVDARGRPRGVLSSTRSEQGQDLHLTLDLAAQQYASGLMEGHRGTLIAMDVRNGEVWVLYNNPTYDPNPLAWGVSSREWRDLVQDKNLPLMNRAINGLYSPGSTWKALTGYTALATGVVNLNTTIRCGGVYRLGAQSYRCWRRSGHGSENILKALRDSCDVFFYETSQKVGIDRYLAAAKKFGLDRPTGIDLPNESSGNLAGPEWKKSKKLGPWYKGDTVNYSIGQGYLLLTPLQMASLFATVANGGNVVTPHLYKDIDVPARPAGLNQEALAIVRKGLSMVTAPGGTGARANGYGVQVAGKTGTVQNAHGDDHGVFVGYAPADDPQFVTVVFLEAGKSGGKEAAPLVGKMLSYLVNQTKEGAQ